MKKILLIAAVFLITLSTACGQLLQPAATMKKQWETGPGLKVPESVLYDTAFGVIYVANVNGKPADKDSNGFIATVSIDGKILNAGWLKGLDAPKGMGILNNHLFVTDIDKVVEIDISTAKVLNSFPVEGAQFLNDIAIDPKTGLIFITDSGTGQVFVILNGKASLWLEGAMFKGANGLCLADSMLYIGTGNSILQADIKSGEVLVTIPNSGGVDGLYVTPDGRIIFSDFKGSVFTAGKTRKPELMLNTTDQKANAADFGVISTKNMILIPTFYDNKVVCYTSPLIR
jgi:DNA-binding beta-propeller fold protein YncE